MRGWLRSRLQRSFPVEFVAGGELLELHLASPNRASACFRIARPAVPSDAAALSEELGLLARDRVFEQALEAAAYDLGEFGRR